MRKSTTWMAMKDSDRVSQVLPAQSREARQAERRMRRHFPDCNTLQEALASWSAAEVKAWVDIYDRCRPLGWFQRRAFNNYVAVVGD